METGKIIATQRNSAETLEIGIKFNIAPHRALQKNILKKENLEQIEKFYSWVAMGETLYLEVGGKRVAKAKFGYNVFSGRGNVESVLLEN